MLEEKSTPKGERSRAQIMLAARELIVHEGFFAITIQDILDKAEITKGKFFHHFQSKEDLFSQLLIQTLNERGFVRFSDVLKNCKLTDPFERLIFIVDTIIEWHKTGLPDSMRLCVFATAFFASNSPEFKEIRQALSANMAATQSLFKECIEQGFLPKDLDPVILSGFFPSLAIGANTVGFFGGGESLPHKNIIELKKILLTLRKVSSGKQGDKVSAEFSRGR